jgi:hypothetical protein
MQRARGPWWTALVLLAPSVIAACDRDEGDTVVSSDETTAGTSAGSDDSEASSDDGNRGPLTCDELMCPAGQVCVEPQAYCDQSTDPPELRQEPAYCQPTITPPGRATVDGELVLSAGVAMCEDTSRVVGADGQTLAQCPEPEIPCE